MNDKVRARLEAAAAGWAAVKDRLAAEQAAKKPPPDPEMDYPERRSDIRRMEAQKEHI